LLPLIFCGFVREILFPGAKTPPEVLQKIISEHHFERRYLDVAPGVRLLGLEKKPRSPQSPWVLFFSGNAVPIGSAALALEAIAAKNDWGLATYAYRGYEESTGKTTEASLVGDAELIARDLLKRYAISSEQLFVMGQSLGTGVAAQLAVSFLRKNEKLAGLILISPYTSLPEAATELIPVIPVGGLVDDRLDTRSILRELNLRTLIVHGTQDNVISVDHSRLIAKELGDRALYFELPHRSHNDIFADKALPKIIAGFVESTPVSLPSPENTTEVSEATISHSGVGTAYQSDSIRDAKSYSIFIPIRAHGLTAGGKAADIIAYDSSTTIELGTTVISDSPKVLFGIDGKTRVGVGLHTPGTVVLYGMGLGELTTTLHWNGLTTNQLGIGIGAEGGAGVIRSPFILTLGAFGVGEFSLLNPVGDHIALEAGARLRVAVKDKIFARAEARKNLAHAGPDPETESGDLFLDYKLNQTFRPRTPALKVMVGVDGRIKSVEDNTQQLKGKEGYAGLHLVFYTN
jgi:pimeloyl-ACP methyl ester carboxylesterase